MNGRYEVVSAAKDRHWARFIAANGKTVWTTETYKRRKAAENAISVVTGQFIQHIEGMAGVWNRDSWLEVRYVTELTEVKRPALELS